MPFKINYPHRPALGPVIRLLSLFGMWSTDRSRPKTILFHITLIFWVIYATSVLVNLLINFNFDLFMNFIQYSSFYLNVHKTIMFTLHNKGWVEVVDAIIELERESCSEKGSAHAKVVYKYKKYSQIITLGYFVPLYAMLLIFLIGFWIFNVLLPILTHPGELEPLTSVLYAILPFDQNKIRGRYMSAFLQTLFVFTTSTCTITWDSLLMASTVFFTGQLKALRARCVHALDSPNEEICWRNIVKCHRHHIAFMKCQKLYNSLISPITFLHILQVSIVCGVCVIKIVLLKNSMSELIRTIDLLFGIYFQLMLFYFVANRLIVESEFLSYGLFESEWIRASLRVRRAVLLLCSGMRQRVAFTAGPFNEMSLPTLVSIVYTLYHSCTMKTRQRSQRLEVFSEHPDRKMKENLSQIYVPAGTSLRLITEILRGIYSFYTVLSRAN